MVDEATKELNSASLTMSGQLPHIHANGFTTDQSTTEINTVFQYGPRPLIFLSMTYTVAKTYAGVLDNIIKDFEAKTGRDVPTVDELFGKLTAGST